VTKLRMRTLEELERRNYSQATARTYIGAIRGFAAYFHRSPDQLGAEEIRQYQLHLVDRELHPKTIRIQTAALRFFYRKVLRRPLFADDAPLPKVIRHQPPTVLSRDEVARLIEAAPNDPCLGATPAGINIFGDDRQLAPCGVLPQFTQLHLAALLGSAHSGVNHRSHTYPRCDRPGSRSVAALP